jgi:hypothetical protein
MGRSWLFPASSAHRTLSIGHANFEIPASKYLASAFASRAQSGPLLPCLDPPIVVIVRYFDRANVGALCPVSLPLSRSPAKRWSNSSFQVDRKKTVLKAERPPLRISRQQLDCVLLQQ